MSSVTYNRMLVVLTIALAAIPWIDALKSNAYMLALLVLLALCHVNRLRATEERVFVVAVLTRHRDEWLAPMQIVVSAKGQVSETIVGAVLRDLEEDKIVAKQMQLERWEDGIMSGMRCLHYQLRQDALDQGGT